MSHDNELCGCLSKRFESDKGDRENKRNNGQTKCLIKKKIIWRARRGLLENDIILKRFFSKYQKNLSKSEWLALEKLLDKTDNELLDIILGIEKLNENALSPETLSILSKLRSC